MKSRISNTEWGLVIGALLLIDLAQILLDAVVIGVFLNRGIDIIVGMALSFYLHIRGESMGDPKRLFSFFAAFGLELLPGTDALPLWSADGVYNFALAKLRDRQVAKQEKVLIEEEKQKKIALQRERSERIVQIREQQQMQREQEREEEREERQDLNNETNAADNGYEDVDEMAA